jgi:hypothetical protein
MYIPPGTKAKLLLPPETANWPMRTPEGFHLSQKRQVWLYDYTL